MILSKFIKHEIQKQIIYLLNYKSKFVLYLFRKIGTTKFIQKAIEERLKMNIEYITTWPKAMALNALPTNAPQALDTTGTLIDHIWYYAGDRSHDVSKFKF